MEEPTSPHGKQALLVAIQGPAGSFGSSLAESMDLPSPGIWDQKGRLILSAQDFLDGAPGLSEGAHVSVISS